MKRDDRLPNPSPRVHALRGVAALVLGVLALLWPSITLLVLVSLFAAYALVAGTGLLVGALRRRGTDGWILALLLGIVSVATGALAIAFPISTTLVLVLLMGVNAVLTGVLDIALAIRLRKVIEGEWMMVLSGVVSLLFGAIVIAVPTAGALALVWLVSFYAICIGLLHLALAWRQSSWMERHSMPNAA